MGDLLEKLREAEIIVKRIDHLIYSSFPLIKDKKLLLIAVSEIKEAIKKCISIILQKEAFYKRIRLDKRPEVNLETFERKCAPRYQITKEDINLLKELFRISEMHRQSPFEFVKDDKVIMLSENSEVCQMDFERAKDFMELGKKIFEKTKKSL